MICLGLNWWLSWWYYQPNWLMSWWKPWKVAIQKENRSSSPENTAASVVYSCSRVKQESVQLTCWLQSLEFALSLMWSAPYPLCCPKPPCFPWVGEDSSWSTSHRKSCPREHYFPAQQCFCSCGVCWICSFQAKSLAPSPSNLVNWCD